MRICVIIVRRPNLLGVRPVEHASVSGEVEWKIEGFIGVSLAICIKDALRDGIDCFLPEG
jgi:hypothetical protein